MKKRCFAILTICGMLLSLASCGAITISSYVVPDSLTVLEDTMLAENNRFSLQWDGEKQCVLLHGREDNYVWSTIPYGAYQEDSGSVYLNSLLFIDYFNTADNAVTTERGYLAVEDGTTSAEKIENGILVTYYFRELELTIPIRLTLMEDYLDITLHAEDIVESGKNKILSISLAPNLCSVANTVSRSSYLFIPTGSGALMYTDEALSTSERRYTGEVYGTDGGRLRLDVVEDEEKVTLPIFAAKAEDDHALLAIIDQGAEAARLEAAVGNRRYGYSQVYPSFLIRGYDEVEQMVANVSTDAKAMADTWAKDAVYSVNYYPLSGKDADYNGMANRYRQWLETEGLLTKQTSIQMPYQVELVGGAQKTEYLLGVPYTSTVALTTFEEAKGLLETLTENTAAKPSVLLSGFGTSGADVGQVAGGYRFGGDFGSAAQQKALETYCQTNAMPLFTDFELARFSKNGSGFTTLFDTAKTANCQPSAVYPLLRNIRSPDKHAAKVRMLKRSELNKAMEKLLRFTDKRVSGISMGSLGNNAYSDYTSRDTYMKNGIGEQVREMMSTAQKAGHAVSLRGGHAYAGGLADSISDLPLSNGNYRVFDEEIPFYSMIFRGYVPLYSQPLNTESDRQALLLRAVEFGIAPTFLLTARDDLELSATRAGDFYTTSFSQQKDYIIETVKQTLPYYREVAGATIVSHQLLTDGVAKTVYDNGVAIYVNHAARAVTVDGLTIPAQSWLMP